MVHMSNPTKCTTKVNSDANCGFGVIMCVNEGSPIVSGTILTEMWLIGRLGTGKARKQMGNLCTLLSIWLRT